MNRDQRLDELLIARATHDLSAQEERELQELLAGAPFSIHNERYDVAAAALDLAVCPDVEPMPDALRQRIAQDAQRFMTTLGAHDEHVETSPVDLDAGRQQSPGTSTTPKTREGDKIRPLWPVWSAWAAAAAALVLAAIGWWKAIEPGDAPRADVAAQRAELVAGASDLVTLAWTATDDPAAKAAGGDVVWSPSQQSGFMRFSGLQSNDPSVSQYQLWVFDATRDERYPVDGGVFDIPPGVDEIIVPIDAKVFVHEASLFAVTVEKPGGVVVSDRERIVVVAQVPALQG